MKTESTSLISTIGRIAAVTFMIIMTACKGPVSKEIIGKIPAKLEPGEWNGKWRLGDHSYFVRVAEGAAGKLEVATVEASENKFNLSVNQVFIRQEGDALVYNMVTEVDSDHSKKELGYFFGRVICHDGTILAWPCRMDAMEDLIKKRVISGKVTGEGSSKEVFVTGGYDQLAKKLGSPEGWLMLQMDDPVVLTRESNSL